MLGEACSVCIRSIDLSEDNTGAASTKCPGESAPVVATCCPSRGGDLAADSNEPSDD
ncbi:hypothetical protein DPMN_061542 [Dreissena polymorpha]|uniref:Uncharacterized protein n=1 Tax=Dreissena polymorpha TaxID=45954 RepID=A0A9D4C780_DREPO|nr:hypothetical protein DPMN_061451 [Dreissena polymorpha]KAH3718736.1 hypothetical protein DPMN_061542 [Dreissena polymorpha]